MIYSGPLSDQIIIFIRCIGLGVLLGLIYEVFSALRCMISDKIPAYVICDVAFSLIATLISFFFMVLYNNGRVRLNLVFAQLIGGVAFHMSCGRYLLKPLTFIVVKIRRVISTLFLPVKKLIEKLSSFFSSDGRVPMKKKIKNIVKIPLKKRKK